MYIATTHSTNTLMKTMLPREEFFTIWAGEQTAGRGQAGNSWEAEPGKNLTFSTLLRPDDIPVEAFFRLNMLVSLAVVYTIQRFNSEANDSTIQRFNSEAFNGCSATIKWPNDIYIGDKKVCGILIENILGEKKYAIAGVGLNVNQRVFVSNAPNPTSLALETGHEWELEPLLEQIIKEMKALRPLLCEPEELKSRYMRLLYRREGYWPYVEREVSTAPTMIQQGATPETFDAQIADIKDDGTIVLERRDGEKRNYHFKQIRYVL